MTGSAFDSLARQYDSRWSDGPVGWHQRRAVWRCVDAFFKTGSRILDVGCGTGTDALHWTERGIEVVGIDASHEMVRLARERGIRARRLAIENLGDLPGDFDGIVSNFGALNCISDLGPVAGELARLVRRGGFLAICLMGPCCAWEIAYYLLRLRPRMAFRRWKRAGAQASIGVLVHYPSLKRIVRSFRGDFQLLEWRGIGLWVPPSYVHLAPVTIARLAGIDRLLAHRPGFRAICDHRLLVFKRL